VHLPSPQLQSHVKVVYCTADQTKHLLMSDEIVCPKKLFVTTKNTALRGAAMHGSGGGPLNPHLPHFPDLQGKNDINN